MDTVLAGRVIQGTGGGGILGLSATVIGDVFSPRYTTKCAHDMVVLPNNVIVSEVSIMV